MTGLSRGAHGPLGVGPAVRACSPRRAGDLGARSEVIEVETRELGRLKRDAAEKIIFHATPKALIDRAGPRVLERGDGAILYDADGHQYLDALSGGDRATRRSTLVSWATSSTSAPTWSAGCPRGRPR